MRLCAHTKHSLTFVYCVRTHVKCLSCQKKHKNIFGIFKYYIYLCKGFIKHLFNYLIL